MKFFYTATVFVCLCLLAAAGQAAEAAPSQGVQWQLLEPGLDLARVALSIVPSSDADSGAEEAEPLVAAISILRIDPGQFEFSLYMASEKGQKTLADVGTDENFAAAINAGMYKRDRLTNTGYLRSPNHTNNNHVAANFGSFFVAGPDDKKLPSALLLDRHEHDWQAALAQYGLVMQNYRMATPAGRVVWKQAERRHSVAALSQDTAGNILFILCPDPVPATDFLKALQRLPLGLTAVMYLEGGSEAALYLNAGGVKTVLAGRHISGFWGGSGALPLPNVLGVRRKAGP